jgi:hypothetical protein
MPRRDGDVFLLGTAMTVSPYVRSNRFSLGRKPKLWRGSEWLKAGL